MLSENKVPVFTKENMDMFLQELAKEIKRTQHPVEPIEIILVGGASILVNYSFREMTRDIDAIFRSAYSLKEAINHVGDKFTLPYGWINTDFMKTNSYSSELIAVSKYYKTFYHVLSVRTVSAEYLIAMKLRSGRRYKNDWSDIAGILDEHKKQGIPISMDKINVAVEKLYGGWQNITSEMRDLITELLANEEYTDRYFVLRADETATRQTLLEFENKYPHVANDNNVQDILATLQQRNPDRRKESIVAKLRKDRTGSQQEQQREDKQDKHNDKTL